MSGMYGNGQLAAKRILNIVRRLLLNSVVAVVMMTSWSFAILAENSGGYGDSRSDTPQALITGTDISIDHKTKKKSESAIDFHNGNLSVSLSGVPLHQVVAELSDQTGIEILFIGKPSSSSVQMQFSNSPLEKGLRLLLSGEDSIFVYADTGGDENSDRQITKILLLPKGMSGHGSEVIKVTDVTSEMPRQKPPIPRHINELAQDTSDRVTEQIKNLIPHVNTEVNPVSSLNGIFSDQDRDALAEELGNSIFDASQSAIKDK